MKQKNDLEPDDELTPVDEAEYRRLRLALRASYGFPSAVEAFSKAPDVPDWLWRIVMRKAVANLFALIPKRARDRYLKLRSMHGERRGRPRKLDAEFRATFDKYRASGLSEGKAVSRAIDDHNKAHHDRFVADARTGIAEVKRSQPG